MVRLYWQPVGADESRSAYGLLRQAWAELRGGEMPEILRQPGGKPYFAENPLYFSLSHTRTLALCAVSDGPVGADIETIRPLRPGLARRVLSDMEYDQYLAAADQELVLLQFWTLKEAWAKQTGRGLRGFPNHTTFDLQTLTLKGAPQRFQLHRIEDCVAAVCTE